MAYFNTIEEKDRVLEAIEKKEDIDGLTIEQKNAIRGMYWAVEIIENVLPDEIDGIQTDVYPLQSIINDIACKAINATIDRVKADIFDTYLTFRDENATKEIKP